MLFQESLVFGISNFKGIHQTNFELWNSLWFKDHKTASKVLSNLHETSIIFEHPAVIGCTEYRDQLSVCKKLVAVVHDQVTPAHQIDFIFLAEFFYDLLIEGETDPSLILLPFSWLLLGVTPQDITQEAGVRDVGGPLYVQYLLRKSQFWRETSVHTKNFVLNYRRYGQIIEKLRKLMP